MNRWLTLALLVAALPAAAESTVLIVQGLGGNEYYRTRFNDEVAAVETAAASLAPTPAVRVFREKEANRDEILAYMEGLTESMGEQDRLYVFLIGHGSFDDEEYKFNIRGPDLTDADLRAALDANPSTNQLVVNTSSASGAAADAWEADNRVVISATRSGRERHATFFGEYFVEALFSESADIDKNEIVSAQEAFNYADGLVAERFETNGNLATEHARLDGQRADRFGLARLGAARPVRSDARLAELSSSRDEIAGRIEELRLARDDMPNEVYQSELLTLMLEMAEAEEAIEAREAELNENE